MAGNTESLASFFNSAELSDVQIVFGDERIQAHKIILAQNSEFFRKEFRGGSQTEICLHDCASRAVRGLLAYCYGKQYDGTGSYSSDTGITRGMLDPLLPNEEGVEYLTYVCDLYVVARRYEVTALAARITNEFPRLLRTFDCPDGAFNHMEKLAQHVYNHGDVARVLRVPLVDHFTKHMDALHEAPTFAILLATVPTLAGELVQALAKERKAVRSRSSTPAQSSNVEGNGKTSSFGSSTFPRFELPPTSTSQESSGLSSGSPLGPLTAPLTSKALANSRAAANAPTTGAQQAPSRYLGTNTPPPNASTPASQKVPAKSGQNDKPSSLFGRLGSQQPAVPAKRPVSAASEAAGPPPKIGGVKTSK